MQVNIQDTTGGIAFWSLGCGLIAWLMLRVGNGKLKGRGVEFGVTVPKGTKRKTVLLALAVVAVGALIPILVIPFVPILGIAGYLSVKLQKLTGNIWLGGLVNAMLITMITVSNTSFTFPY